MIAMMLNDTQQFIFRNTHRSVLEVIPSPERDEITKLRKIKRQRDLNSIGQLQTVATAAVVLEPLQTHHQHRGKHTDSCEDLCVTLAVTARDDDMMTMETMNRNNARFRTYALW